MKRITLFIGSLGMIALFSCEEKAAQMEVHSAVAESLDVAVVNAVDPVCEMEMPKFLKDTLTYNHEVYGFCNVSCKNDFKANPEKYLQALKGK